MENRKFKFHNSQFSIVNCRPRRRLLVAGSWLLAALLPLCSCHQSDKSVAQKPVQEKGLPILVTDGSTFPAYLAGVWQQEGQIAREFVISKDGRLISAVLGLGLVRVSPTQETRVSLIDKGEGVFVPGKWAASYAPLTRELQISLEMTSVQFQAGKQAVEGVIRESFIGPISDDGKHWNVNYFALPEYHAFTKEGEHVVLSDGTEPEEQEMVFNRVENPTK